ncbi:MAG: FAD binding domain-containing protein [bacterium]
MLSWQHYLMPGNLEEALRLLDRFSGQHRIVAGATDLLPQAREGGKGDTHFQALVDISRIPELAGVSLREGRLTVGANTTIADCLRNPMLLSHAPVLAQCAAWFGDDAIREVATLAGNLVNASPAADGTTALLALDAQVTLERLENGNRVKRELSLREFVTGPRKTRIREGEILTAIAFDALEKYGSAFEKVGQRRALLLSTVCLAALAGINSRKSHFVDVRLALGGIGPTPVRLTECEHFLNGRPANFQTIREAVGLLQDVVRSRTRREYRREVVRGFVERALTNALAGCGVTGSPWGIQAGAKEMTQGGVA